jgi:DUF4097 and DUF4098 domain-containing protein YvlB
MKRFIGIIVMLAGFGLLALSWSGRTPEWRAEQQAAIAGDVNEIRLEIEADTDVSIVAEDRADLAVSLEGSGSLELSRQPSGLVIEASRSGMSWFPFESTVVVRLPQSYNRSLTVSGEHGSVRMTGGTERLQLGRLNVMVDAGSLQLDNVSLQELHYTTDKGELLAENTDLGSSALKLDSGKIMLRQVKGSLQADIGTGDIQAQAAALDKAVMNIRNGGISLADYAGDWTATIGTGGMNVEQFSGGKGTLSIGKGDFNASHYKGDWDVRLGKGSVNITDSMGDWKAVMTKGNFNAQQLAAGQGTLRIVKGGLNATAYSGGLTATIVNGDVNVGLGDAAKPVAVHVTSGTINVGLPPRGDYTLQAAAPHGSVASAASLTGVAVPDEHYVQVKIGAGIVPITLQNDKGDVIVNETEGGPAANR